MLTKRARIRLEAALADLPGWAAVPGRDAVARSWRFPSFNAAFGFMGRLALQAERLDHHPEWRNVYDQVEVVLWTHSVGGVSPLDVELGRFMDKAAAEVGAQPL